MAVVRPATTAHTDRLAARLDPWLRAHFDPAVGLVWNPPGSLDDEGVPPRCLHQLPQSGWFALTLAAAGDGEGVAQVVEAVLTHQYREPGTSWHGTFSRFAESPAPTQGAVEFVDYDPNWRQFLGIALALLLRRHRRLLDDDLARRMEDAIALAVDGEQASERLHWYYTNIAVQHAWLLAEYGDAAAGRALGERIAQGWRRHRTFPEYNSPTYDGVTAWALALWRGESEVLADLGAELETGMWAEIAHRYHPGLANMVGPYGRAYGLDMERYVSKLGLLLTATDPAGTPVPEPSAPTAAVAHGHDLYALAAIAEAPPLISASALARLTQLASERTVTGTITTHPTQRAHSAWLGDDVMIGAESGDSNWTGWFQFVAGTVHWRTPEGGVGVLRYVPDGPPQGTVEPGVLHTEAGATFEVHLHDGAGMHSTRAVPGDPGVTVLDEGHTTLPGLIVDNHHHGDSRTLEVTTP